jgi:hypothetical protein
VGNDGVNRIDLLGMMDFLNPGEGWDGQFPLAPGKCCCIEDPDKCSLKVTWRKEGKVVFGGGTKPGQVVKPGDVAMQAQVYAKVRLIHSEGKDVSGCTTEQHAITNSPNIPVQLNTPADITSTPPGYNDDPTISSAWNIVDNNLPAATITARFHAYVKVVQVPSIKTDWGFKVEVSWDANAKTSSAKFIDVTPAPDQPWK